MSEKSLLCSKFKDERPALLEAPLKGPIGQLILEHVSQDAWNEWVELEIKIINEERLDLSEVKAQKRLFSAMVDFLDLSDYIDPSSI
jgi:Fe-S cluster biosynthesis and repair protein YggX